MVEDSGIVSSNNEFWVANDGTGTLNLKGGTITANNWIALGRGGMATINISGGILNKEGGGNLITDGSVTTINNLGSQTWLSEADNRISGWTASNGIARFGVLRLGRVVNSSATLTLSGTADYSATNAFLSSNEANSNGGTSVIKSKWGDVLP